MDTPDDLHKFLDAHGKDGASVALGLCVIHHQGVGPSLAVVTPWGDIDALGEKGLHPFLVSQHAPLPPLSGRFERCDTCVGSGHVPAYRDVMRSEPCDDCGPATHPLAAPGVAWRPAT